MSSRRRDLSQIKANLEPLPLFSAISALSKAQAETQEESIMNAREIMTSPVISVEPEAAVLQAIRIMLQRRISGLPMIDKDAVWSELLPKAISCAALKPERSAGARAGSNS